MLSKPPQEGRKARGPVPFRWGESNPDLEAHRVHSTSPASSAPSDRARDPNSCAALSQIKAADLRDGFSACVGREDDVELLNNQMMEILGGHLVEFCSQERNTLIHEVAPRLQVRECAVPAARATPFPTTFCTTTPSPQCRSHRFSRPSVNQQLPQGV